MADNVDIKTLFKAGAHFGHQKSRTDARSSDYIYSFKNRIAVIDLAKTRDMINDTLNFIAKKAQEGSTFLLVGSKLQAKEIIKRTATEIEMPYVIERWPGGLVTNFETVSRSIRKMVKTEEELAQNKFDHLTKNERLKIEKNLQKSDVIFGGLRNLKKIPDVIVVVDAKKEEIAIKEANNKKIPTVGICDTNTNPKILDYPIVSNDDSRAAIELIIGLIGKTIKENYKPQIKSEDVEERLEKKLEAKPESKKPQRKSTKE